MFPSIPGMKAFKRKSTIPRGYGGDGGINSVEKVYHMLTPKPKTLLQRNRELVKHGELIYFSPNTMSKKPRYFFLFNDCLLITKRTGQNKFLLRLWMYLRGGVKIYSMPDSPNYEFRIIVPVKGSVKTTKQRRLIIYAKNRDQKDSWVNEIARCLWICAGRHGPDPTKGGHIPADDEKEEKAAQQSSKTKKKAPEPVPEEESEEENISYGSDSEDEEPVEEVKNAESLILFDPFPGDKPSSAPAQQAAPAPKSTDFFGMEPFDPFKKDASTTPPLGAAGLNPALYPGMYPYGYPAFNPYGGVPGQGAPQYPYYTQTPQGVIAVSPYGFPGAPGMPGAPGVPGASGSGGFPTSVSPGTLGATGSGGFPTSVSPGTLGATGSGGFPTSVSPGVGIGATGSNSGSGSGGFSPTFGPGAGGAGAGIGVGIGVGGAGVGAGPNATSGMFDLAGVFGPDPTNGGLYNLGGSSSSQATLGANPPNQFDFAAIGLTPSNSAPSYTATSGSFPNNSGLFPSPGSGSSSGSASGSGGFDLTARSLDTSSSGAANSSLNAGAAPGAAGINFAAGPALGAAGAAGGVGISGAGGIGAAPFKGDMQPSVNLDQLAQDELLQATRLIEELTKALAGRPRKTVEHKPLDASAELDMDDISDAILEATQSIARAASLLLNAAAVAQKDRVLQDFDKAQKSATLYHADPIWAQGLISAARYVVATTQNLIHTADASTKGQAKEEVLIAASQSVAAATAQLVAAQRAKGDTYSTSHQGLESAAKGIALATAQLVNAAKLASDKNSPAPQPANQNRMTITEKEIEKLDKKAKVLQLEKETERLRRELEDLNKKEYGH
eukprot:TRINITY_DN1651_c0_g1_i1.p1 TRINITY_DN1651_c0_g1~~TRINITY_DN1651_c0_g1_i1.p1  ORF type:complete len:838 (+),score=273.94 TRINITY_DN1651_c0_g1_i1:86-2599(+)